MRPLHFCNTIAHYSGILSMRFDVGSSLRKDVRHCSLPVSGNTLLALIAARPLCVCIFGLVIAVPAVDGVHILMAWLVFAFGLLLTGEMIPIPRHVTTTSSAGGDFSGILGSRLTWTSSVSPHGQWQTATCCDIPERERHSLRRLRSRVSRTPPGRVNRYKPFYVSLCVGVYGIYPQ